MTTLFATTAAVERTKDSTSVTAGRVVLWVGQFVIAAAFLMAGGTQHPGGPAGVVGVRAVRGGPPVRYRLGTGQSRSAVWGAEPALGPPGAPPLAGAAHGGA